MARPVQLISVILIALALATCGGDTQSNGRGIDQDIAAAHGAGGATLDNIGQHFAPWSIGRSP